ncbi:MAG: DUF3874 domain-containing protein [Prevotella sp.]|nr:DUF3874 domain-containing protein [Prevotella sp.]
MRHDYLINGEALCASTKGMLETEHFLQDNYLFRQNVLNGKVEFAVKESDSGITAYFMPLTQQAMNSIIVRAMREGISEKGNPQSEIKLLLQSDEVPRHDPIREFLNNLPTWDGQNHVARLLSRLPGLSTEQSAYLATWLRSTVAHWLQLDTLHGNECVPVLIGAQGCGKTTFLRRLLPQHLRQYYLDHLNLSNKFDKEMALTNNLLVNLDELDAIRPSQHAALKQTLSKNKVNGRPIYGASQQDRPRYASFVATTNNPHPLTDATGSRRYICLTIPNGMFIDNTGDIDYEQLYAQIIYEIREQKTPYWFSNDEVARIQMMNNNYMEQKDMAEIVTACFRKPKENETVKPLNSSQMLKLIQAKFPSLKSDHSTRIHLGQAMKELGYERTEWSHVAYYKVVPLLSA